MASPYTFAGPGYSYEDTAFQGQFYNVLEDGPDSNMPYINSDLQNPSQVSNINNWDAPVQRYLKETPRTNFFVADIPGHMPNCTPIRPTVGIPAVPPPSQTRFASPISSVGPSSSGSAFSPPFSPPADADSYYDNTFPRTPSDTALLSPFPTPMDSFSNAQAVQFTGTGIADYTNPFDDGDSENGIIDFNFSHHGYGFDGLREAEPAQSSAAPTFNAGGIESPQATSNQQLEASTRYSLPPQQAQDQNPQAEVPTKRPNPDANNDDDYRPNKRPKTTKPQSSTNRNLTTRRRARPGGDPPSTFTCPDTSCTQRKFTSQSDLDAHTKKHHNRPFNCVFDFAGCPSTFASKNEWKRHVATQHLLLNYYVCTDGACATKPPPSSPCTGAIFNRKDLFGNGFLVTWAFDGVRVGFTTQHDYRDTFFFLIPGFCFFLGLDT
ncbi:hypothetical protein N0V88_000983 [Collariella sp. IMI 366227]|nr:hypothetical protein N0V88_000983 [Collariella sp. IMI 366227]